VRADTALTLLAFVVVVTQQISEMGTPYQYVLVSDNPQREARFRKKRAENAKVKGNRGSFYAFHGSAIGNWHSIFRGGLRNYSNTDKMSCGAAYGPGIYMASNASTSFGYMAAGAGWDKSMMIKSGTASTIACIALCEGTHTHSQHARDDQRSLMFFFVACSDRLPQ
jgi:poly [ADP-ribose] polymerase 6/8